MDQKHIELPHILERVPNSLLISEMSAIEESGYSPTTRESLSKLVEAPLLEACEDLYDKNIRTAMSSANKKDIEYGGHAYIDIDFDSLSEENKTIAMKLGELFSMRGFKPTQGVKIVFPVNENTTVGDVRKMAHDAVTKFLTQKMTWATTYTLGQLREDEMNPDLQPTDVSGLFYDEPSGLFYISREQAEKVKNSQKP